MIRSFALGCLSLLALSAGLARAEFTPVGGWEKQLFPSYVIAAASLKGADQAPSDDRLGDPLGLLGAVVEATENDVSIRVTIECPEFLEKSVFTGTLPEKGKTYEVFPKMKYRYDRLAKCDQATPASVSYRVQIGDQPEEEQTLTFTIRSVNDCPFVLTDGKESIDIGFTFAAYVNEQHPFVDKLLREALDRGVVDHFTGYQSGDPNQTVLQAYALWDVLVQRDVRYSSITATVASSDTVGSQHVRMIEESVNNSQANCVDGSVLWVSMLRKIGIDAFLVLEPTHCYAGFFADADRKIAFGVETTLLGANIEVSDEAAAEFDDAIAEDVRDEYSFPSFAKALDLATAKLAKSRKENDETVKIIDIANARKLGVLPIPFLSKAEFVPFEHSLVGSEYEEIEADEEEESDDEEDSDE